MTAGDGSGPPIALAVASRLWAAGIAAFPETALGDAFMDGAVTFERGDVYDLLALAGRNLRYRRPAHPPSAFRRWPGERFCRRWEFYLAASEVGFRYAGHMVFQLQLARRVDVVPLTRDYIGEGERQLAERRAIAA